MNEETYEQAIGGRALIRVDTLIRLRWYAIIGQAGAVITVAFLLQYPMHWQICLVLIAASTALNLLLTHRYNSNHRLRSDGAFALLMFDIGQLGILLFLTGGLKNPFAILLMVPVVVSSTSLRAMHTVILGTFACVVITLLAFFHAALPWDPLSQLEIPLLFVAGVWVAIVCTLAFTAIYAFRVAEEARKLANALSATELVLQREQHMSALDGLAAAAAHELGTPLATIALVSKEMQHALPKDSEMKEDAELLRSQAERCREILQKLTSLSSEGESIIQTQSLKALVEEEVAPLRDFGIDIEIHYETADLPVPIIQRSPGVHYGLGNLIDNAVDFARSTVVIVICWDLESIFVEISDDGQGFSPSILAKLGEPFVTSRKVAKDGRPRGMGLGLFIAKTLLERSGAELSFANATKKPPHQSGAFICLHWKRSSLEEDAKLVSKTSGATLDTI